MKKIMLIGHGRHGKDTVAELLRDNHGYKLLPASWTFAEEFMREYMGYATTQECFDDRVNYRDLWGDKIADYNTPNPAALATRVMQESDLYVGCRRMREFYAAAPMFDHVVWVDRGMHLPAEPVSSMELGSVDADIIIDNNGTLDDLKAEVSAVVKAGWL